LSEFLHAIGRTLRAIGIHRVHERVIIYQDANGKQVFRNVCVWEQPERDGRYLKIYDGNNTYTFRPGTVYHTEG